MARCEVCDNDYDKTFTVTLQGTEHTFDSFKCAVTALAPRFAKCGVRVLGHGVEVGDSICCCAHCANVQSAGELRDRA